MGTPRLPAVQNTNRHMEHECSFFARNLDCSMDWIMIKSNEDKYFSKVQGDT